MASGGPDIVSLGYSRDYRNGVRVGGVKFVLDGSPQGRTAWMTKPYREGPPGAAADYRAYPTLDPAYLSSARRRADAAPASPSSPTRTAMRRSI